MSKKIDFSSRKTGYAWHRRANSGGLSQSKGLRSIRTFRRLWMELRRSGKSSRKKIEIHKFYIIMMLASRRWTAKHIGSFSVSHTVALGLILCSHVLIPWLSTALLSTTEAWRSSYWTHPVQQKVGVIWALTEKHAYILLLRWLLFYLAPQYLIIFG